MTPRGPGEGGDVHGRFRYTPWHGGPDPLAPPFDVRSALDEVGQDVLAGGSLREALRELMRRGMDGRRGLDDLAERVRRLREAARRRGDLGGTLDQVRAMLDQALAMERDQLAGEEGDDARLAETVDELIDALARRQAAAERLMASLSPEQREQLAQLMADALGDPDLASQMSQLADNLRALRPG